LAKLSEKRNGFYTRRKQRVISAYELRSDFSKSIEELILGIKSKIGVSYIFLVFVFIVKRNSSIESN